jgi:hypothetical protein
VVDAVAGHAPDDRLGVRRHDGPDARTRSLHRSRDI